MEVFKGCAPILERSRALNEIIRAATPHRLYLDIELEHKHASPNNIPWPVDPETFIETWEDRIIEIIRAQFQTEVPSESFYWTSATVNDKFSMHLTIDHRDENGRHVLSRNVAQSKRLLTKLKEAYPSFVPFSDDSVYGRNQKMRMVLSNKVGRNNTLRLVGHSKQRVEQEMVQGNLDADFEHCLITWCNVLPSEQITFYPAPNDETYDTARIKAIMQPVVLNESSATVDHVFTDDENSYTIETMKQLLTQYHPTCFTRAKQLKNTLDSQTGRLLYASCEFQYTDRHERCWSGHCHESRGVTVYVKPDSKDVFAKCWSSRCSQRPVVGLGTLFPDSAQKAFEDNNQTFRVHRRYLSLDEKEYDPRRKNTDPLYLAAEALRDGEIRAMGLKAPMGTGKTNFVAQYLASYPPETTMVCIVHRITLAVELCDSKLKELGFINYLDLNGQEIADRKKSPRLVIQLDSLHKSCPFDENAFDIVIMDEMESLLMHFSAKTLKEPLRKALLLQSILQDQDRDIEEHQRTKLIYMDAFLGIASYSLITDMKIKQVTVRNDYLPPETERRTYEVTNMPKRLFFYDICQKLNAGEKVVVATMQNHGIVEELRQTVLRDAGLSDADIIIYTSQTDDKIKRQLGEINDPVKGWCRAKLLIYTPTIESGVSFDRRHFTQLYIYLTGNAATALAIIQMSYRIRFLECLNVIMVVGIGLFLDHTLEKIQDHTFVPKITTDQLLAWNRWVADTAQEKAVNPDDLSSDKVQIGQLRFSMQELQAHVGDMFRSVFTLRHDEPVLHIINELTDPIRQLFLRNQATLTNNAKRFLLELDAYISEMGSKHTITTYDRSEEAKENWSEAISVNVKEDILLRLKITEYRHKERDRLQQANLARDATQYDKEMHFAYQYADYFGIYFIDRNFIKFAGLDVPNKALQYLVVQLKVGSSYCDDVTNDDNSGLQDMVARAALIDELIAFLGYRHLFDHETSLSEEQADTLAGRVHEENGPRIFKDYTKSCRLFGIKRRQPEQYKKKV